MGPPPPQVLLTPPPATSAGMARRRWPPPEGLQKRHRLIPLPPPEQPIPGRRPPQSAPERCGHPYSAKWPYACASLSRLAVELRAQTHPTRPGLAPGGRPATVRALLRPPCPAWNRKEASVHVPSTQVSVDNLHICTVPPC